MPDPMTRRGDLDRLMFREFSWFLASLFLSWDFDPDRHRDDGSSSAQSWQVFPEITVVFDGESSQR